MLCAEDYLYNGAILSALSPPSGEMHKSPFYWTWHLKQRTPLTLYHTAFDLFDQALCGKPGVMLKLRSWEENSSWVF